MVDNIIRKPLGFVLLAAAHMVFNGSSQAEDTKSLGSSVTLEFRFNDSVVIDENSHFAVYKSDHTKIAEHKSKGNVDGGVLDIYRNTSVRYHIKKLRPDDRGIYWASLFNLSEPPRESNRVQLKVQDWNKSSTVFTSLMNTTTMESDETSTYFSLTQITALVAPVVLLAAALPLLVWCLVRTKEKQQQHKSNPTPPETVAGSNSVPPPSLIYSVLDFAKAPPAASDMNPTDTEYAAVSYLPEKRHM